MVHLGPGRFSEWVAQASWESIEFISDLHLAPQTPRTLDAWEHYLGTTRADAVFILGDLFDSWVGDDSRFEAFEAHCVSVLARASATMSLAFMVGNRDFLVGTAMCQASGMQMLSDPTVLVAFAQRILLSHGDALCLADTEYQQLRTVVRNPEWQRDLLAWPLEQRRDLARELRAASSQHRAGRSRDEWADIDVPLAFNWLDRANSKTLIHGHTHRPGTDSPARGYRRHVLSDWSFDDPQAPRAEVLRLDASGLQRHSLAR